MVADTYYSASCFVQLMHLGDIFISVYMITSLFWWPHSNILCECTIIYLLLWTFKLFMSLYIQWISCRQHICDWVLLCFPNQTISAFNWGYLEHLHCVITNIIMTIIFLFFLFDLSLIPFFVFFCLFWIEYFCVSILFLLVY